MDGQAGNTKQLMEKQKRGRAVWCPTCGHEHDSISNPKAVEKACRNSRKNRIRDSRLLERTQENRRLKKELIATKQALQEITKAREDDAWNNQMNTNLLMQKIQTNEQINEYAADQIGQIQKWLEWQDKSNWAMSDWVAELQGSARQDGKPAKYGPFASLMRPGWLKIVSDVVKKMQNKNEQQ